LAQEKVYVDSQFSRSKNQSKIEKDEQELEELMKQAKGEEPEEEPQEKLQEEPQEEQLNAEEKTFKKRYGDLRRHMSEKEKEWEEKFESLKNQTQKTQVIPPKSDEDIEAWASKYPDVAGIVETIAQKKAQELFSKAEKRLQEFDEVQYEAVRTKAETQIRKAHEDFDELRASDAFHDWAEEQPKWVKDALYENADDPASVVRVIDLYKVDKGMTPSARKESTKNAAKTVKTSSAPRVDPSEGGRKIRESEVAKMSDKEFEERWDEIQKAQRNGDFVYDLSGGAR
jgi:chromosome segregation ATPase